MRRRVVAVGRGMVGYISREDTFPHLDDSVSTVKEHDAVVVFRGDGDDDDDTISEDELRGSSLGTAADRL